MKQALLGEIGWVNVNCVDDELAGSESLRTSGSVQLFTKRQFTWTLPLDAEEVAETGFKNIGLYCIDVDIWIVYSCEVAKRSLRD